MAQEFVTLTLGDSPVTFRALDLDQLEALEPQLNLLTSKAGDMAAGSLSAAKDALQATAEIAAASAQAKHPDMTVERMRKLLTLGTLEAVIYAIRGVSGIQPAGEASGEARAGSA